MKLEEPVKVRAVVQQAVAVRPPAPLFITSSPLSSSSSGDDTKWEISGDKKEDGDYVVDQPRLLRQRRPLLHLPAVRDQPAQVVHIQLPPVAVLLEQLPEQQWVEQQPEVEVIAISSDDDEGEPPVQRQRLIPLHALTSQQCREAGGFQGGKQHLYYCCSRFEVVQLFFLVFLLVTTYVTFCCCLCLSSQESVGNV